MGEFPETLVAIIAGGIATAIPTFLVGKRARRKLDAEAAKVEAEAGGMVTGQWEKLSARLTSEIARIDVELCEERRARIALEAELDEERAKRRVLEAKLQAALEYIIKLLQRMSEAEVTPPPPPSEIVGDVPRVAGVAWKL